MTSLSELSARADELRRQVERANELYYLQDAPEISDAEYDRLFRELVDLEREHPELRTADSPTQRVGAVAQSQLPKRQHAARMLSLGNAFTDDELREWEARLRRLVGDAIDAHGYIAELKIDGTAVSLTYERGLLTVGATRGNGVIGEDVTPNLRTLRDVPLRLRTDEPPEYVEIRGEVYIPFEQFERMNEQRARAGEAAFANPRNSAAGSLRQLDPAETARRPLRFFGFGVVTTPGSDLPFATQWELLQTLREWGIPVEQNARRFAALEEVVAFTERVESTVRASLEFGIDGVVVKVNELSLQDELGVVGDREPRWAVARKFAPDIAVTRLLDIRVNVGRTGAINPYAVLEPVEIGGTTVKLATLHNFDLVRDKDLRVGDMVQVKRAGDVIPQIIAPLVDHRDAKNPLEATPVPTHCPSCNTPVQRDEEEVAIYCPNVACPGRQLEALVHFASRSAMDIRGLSYARIQQLLEAGLVHDPADIFFLTADQLVKLERFALKSAENLVASIEESKRQPLSRLVGALGVRHVGEGAAQLLARHFGTLDALAAASEEEIAAVHGIGPIIARSAAAYFNDDSSRSLIDKLRRAGVSMEEPRPEKMGRGLTGQTVVITGTLPTLSRADASSLVEAHGGRVASSVSKNTSFVLAGESPGSKLDKAQTLGVRVLDEAAFRTLIDTPE